MEYMDFANLKEQMLQHLYIDLKGQLIQKWFYHYLLACDIHILFSIQYHLFHLGRYIFF